MLGQLALERRDQSPVLVVDRALAAEVLIVLGDFEHSLAGHVPPAEHVFEKRDHIVRAVGAAEGDHEHGVIAWWNAFSWISRRHGSILSTSQHLVWKWQFLDKAAMYSMMQGWQTGKLSSSPWVDRRLQDLTSAPLLKADGP